MGPSPRQRAGRKSDDAENERQRAVDAQEQGVVGLADHTADLAAGSAVILSMAIWDTSGSPFRVEG